MCSLPDLCVATDSPIPEEQSLPEIEATTSLTSRSSACSKVTSKVQKSNTSRPGLKKRRKKKKKDCQSEITFCDQPGNIFILLHIHSSCLVITNRRLLYIYEQKRPCSFTLCKYGSSIKKVVNNFVAKHNYSLTATLKNQQLNKIHFL